MGHWSDVDILMQASDRRIKLLRLSISMLPLLFRQGARWTLVDRPLPDDAQVVGFSISQDRQELILSIQSDGFSEVTDLAAPIPEIASPAFQDPGCVGWPDWIACGEPSCDSRVYAGRMSQCAACRGFYCEAHRKHGTFGPGDPVTLCLDCIGPPDKVY